MPDWSTVPAAGSRVLVTGAAGGLGQALSSVLVEVGAEVESRRRTQTPGRARRRGPGVPRGRPPVTVGQQEDQRRADDEEVRDVDVVVADVNEVDRAADAARCGDVVHAQAVEQVADPAADRQRRGHPEDRREPATQQNLHGDGQHRGAQEVEQRTRDGIGVPPSDSGADERIAAEVDVCGRSVPPGPPLRSLIQHEDECQQDTDGPLWSVRAFAFPAEQGRGVAHDFPSPRNPNCAVSGKGRASEAVEHRGQQPTSVGANRNRQCRPAPRRGSGRRGSGGPLRTVGAVGSAVRPPPVVAGFGDR